MKKYIKPETMAIMLNAKTMLMAGSDLGLSKNSEDIITDNGKQLSRQNQYGWVDEEEEEEEY